ncbi:MAG: ankyrin repeat domain-containing protein [Planctomycetota bacterium]|nr:ankyrin repeat domain-containing protein [Planctomycetota bacterium]
MGTHRNTDGSRRLNLTTVTEDQIPPSRRAWIFVVSAILAAANLGAAVLGCSMLRWGLAEMEYRGEQWGFFGIIALSFVSLPVMLLLLLPGTIWIATRGRDRTGPGFRFVLMAALAVGVLTNVAALACIPLGMSHRKEELKKEHIVYTSGLYDAVKNRDLKTAESILKRNPQAIRDHTLDLSLLAWAVENDDTGMAKLLLEYGADAKDGGGGRPSPLHVAARRGHISIARLLLEHGAAINAEDSDTFRETPLVYARKANKTEMVRFLESKSAQAVNLKDKASRAQD